MNNTAGNNQPLSERTETLRQLLESELGRPVSYEEAFDTGQALLNFFEVLGAAEDVNKETERFTKVTEVDLLVEASRVINENNCSTLYYRSKTKANGN